MMCNFDIMRSQSNAISASEAAKILHITVRAIHHRINAGTLTAQKLSGKTGAYVLDREEVEAAAQGQAA